MNSRDEDSLEKDDLNFFYKDQTNEERFLNNVIRAESKGTISDDESENNPKASQKKITREEIMKSVMEQAKKIKRDDEKQEGTSEHSYSNVAKTIPWFSEYKKQPINITRDRVRTYLSYYKDLPNLIKLREQQLVSGQAKAESKTIEPEKLQDLSFLKGSNINKLEFMKAVDYKLNEMIFYHTNLRLILNNMKKYMFMGYQFLLLKYFYNFEDKDLKKVVNITNIEATEDALINYLYEKLIEESKEWNE